MGLIEALQCMSWPSASYPGSLTKQPVQLTCRFHFQILILINGYIKFKSFGKSA